MLHSITGLDLEDCCVEALRGIRASLEPDKAAFQGSAVSKGLLDFLRVDPPRHLSEVTYGDWEILISDLSEFCDTAKIRAGNYIDDEMMRHGEGGLGRFWESIDECFQETE